MSKDFASMIEQQEILNQSLKGLMCGLGAGSGISGSITPLTASEPLPSGTPLSDLADWIAPYVSGGDVLVVASKLIAYVEKSVAVLPAGVQFLPNQGAATRAQTVSVFRSYGYEIEALDVLLLDHGFNEGEWLLGLRDPNRSAFELAEAVRDAANVDCDVVVSDSGSGPEKGRQLIGCPTYLATPLGATAGLPLLHCMRCASAAELVRNRVPLTPICVVRPEGERSRQRSSIGQMRYPGRLSAPRESMSLLT